MNRGHVDDRVGFPGPVDLRVGTLIVGGGPAGTAILFEAYRLGLLDDLLKRGLLLVERDRRLLGAGQLGSYGVRSDTTGRVFAECADDLLTPESPARLRALRDACDVDGPVPLTLAARLLSEVAIRMVTEATARAGYDVHLSGCAERLEVGAERSRVTVRTSAGIQRIVADYVVLATGGRPCFPGWLDRARVGKPVIHSDDLLRDPQLLDRCPAALPSSPAISVLGGSHSGFAAASVLLRRDPRQCWPTGAVTIVHRSPIRVMFPSLEAALAEDVAVAPGDVCGVTGRVHRFGGLRGDSAQLWRQIRDGSEKRVRLLKVPPGDDGGRAALEEADLIVAATGYASNSEAILTGSGIALSRAPFDGTGRLVDDRGRVVPHIYCSGLGTGHRRGNTTGGEPSFTGAVDGAWFYRRIVANSFLEDLELLR